jgi:hypothetical protein
MNEEKPITAFILSLMGLVIQALAGLMFFYMIAYWNSMPYGLYGHMNYMTSYVIWFPFYNVYFLLFSVILTFTLGILGIIWMSSYDATNVKRGSLLIVIISLLSFITMPGFFLAHSSCSLEAY